MLLYEERKQVVDYCNDMYNKGLTVGTSGNISVLNRELGLFAISPSSITYKNTTLDDIVIMDLNGNIVDCKNGRKPSTEWKMHMINYIERDDVNATIHSHAPYASACSCFEKDVPAVHSGISITKDEIVPCAKYAYSGSDELARYMADALKGRTAALVSHHGLMVVSKNIERAMMITEEVEFCCKMYILTQSAGGAPVLPREQLQFWG